MRNSSRLVVAALTMLVLALTVQPLRAQDNVRVMVYNILRYGAQGIGACTPTGVTARNQIFTNIMSEAQPDIFAVNEIGPLDNQFSPAANILLNVLSNVPGKGPFYEATQIRFNGSQDICNMLYYNSQKIGKSTQALINAGSFRPLDYYRLYYKSPGVIGANDTTFLHLVVVHFMAGSSTGRVAQANAILNHLNNRGLNTTTDDYIIMGDMNESSPGSNSMQVLFNSSTNPSQTVRDPLNLINWGNSANYTWSQSTRNSSSSDCGAGGGLDDRFDNIFVSGDLINDASDFSYVPGSYWVFGNTFSPNPSIPSSIPGSLVAMSDHYPVIVDLEVSKAVAQTPRLESVVKATVIDGGRFAQIQVPGGYAGQYQVQVVDLQGRVIRDWRWELDEGPQRKALELENVDNGIYVLRLARDGSAPIHCKFVRMH